MGFGICGLGRMGAALALRSHEYGEHPLRDAIETAS